MVSPFWKKGLNISSRKSTELDQTEIDKKTLHFGFHVFKTRKVARQYRQGYGIKDCVVIRCVGLPKDLVGVGKYVNYNALVFTKLHTNLKDR